MKFFSHLHLAALGFLFVACSAAASPSEMQERASVRTAARIAFEEKDFDALERMAKGFRTEKSRTSSGLWKLTVFYAAINDLISKKATSGKSEYREIDSQLEAWAFKHPNSPIPTISRAHMEISRAWEIRGGDVASKVKPEAWKPFAEGIERARVILQKGKAVASVDPQWYEQMMVIAQAQNWERERFDELLNEALAKEPLSYQTYFSALNYLLPKWHGSLGEIEIFARDAVKRTSKTEGEGMYARIYWYASQAQFGNALFRESVGSWPKMKAGFEDVIARYPDSWNLNNYAKFACLANDKATTAKLLRLIGTSIELDAWKPDISKLCIDWANAPG